MNWGLLGGLRDRLGGWMDIHGAQAVILRHCGMIVGHVVLLFENQRPRLG
jgi:hypothetical protein